MLRQSIIILLMVLSGIIGAYASIRVRQGTPGILIWIVGQIALITWAIQASKTNVSLAFSAVLYDAIYNTAWFATYYVCGEITTLKQILGVTLLILATILMA